MSFSDSLINNYFELTYYLVTKYIHSIFPQNNYKLKVTTNESKLKQLELFKNNDEKILTFSFTSLSEIQSLINLLNNYGRLDNALINWEWFTIDEKIEIKFPLETSEISSNLIEKFNKKFRLIVDDEKNSSIFNTDDISKDDDDDGPTIEESNTDTESINAKSPTPEVPYNPSTAETQKQQQQQQQQQQLQQLQQPYIPSVNSAFAQKQQQTKTRQRPADMPDFEDEYEIRDANVNHNNQINLPPIGSDDLNPPGLPKHPTFQPYLDPLNQQQSQQPSGMYPHQDHPIFGKEYSSQTSRLGVPPGARFDDPYSEQNLDNLGQGLPSNLRQNINNQQGKPNPFGNFGPPGSGSGPGSGPGSGLGGFGNNFGGGSSGGGFGL
ncbi:unnamed protein product [Candida verbasci]|uniref:PI31 proteasome regulator C-terminal domain-containing protein n=1 Tax=Candida verbasci TaxID=1227364 RepID=A0A9W4TZQ7_9ASCO|nr:unnamed protein product [Candida verbasci]